MCRPDAGVGVEDIHLDLAAVPATIRVVRTAVQRWAVRVGLDPESVDAVILAVDEAVTNVVDHAGPGASDATAQTGAPGVRVVLRAAGRPCGSGFAVSIDDDGTWRPPPADPGHRGRGVRLIGRLSDRSTITVTDQGTTVRMCWERPAVERAEPPAA